MGTERTTLQKAVDGLLRTQDTTLDEFVAERRSQGASFERIARDLWEMTDGAVDLSSSTLKEWNRSSAGEVAS